MTRLLKTLAGALGVLAVAAAVALAASSPDVSTKPATHIGQNTATLNGSVRPNGEKTFYRFAYGFTPSFGNATAIHTLKAGTAAVNVSAGIGGLLPGTKYYFAVQATNASGSTTSAPRSFTTAGHPLPEPQTGPAIVTSPSTAAVTGVVNPRGQTTSYWFEYAPDGAPAGVDSKTPTQVLPAGSAPVNVSATIYGLAPLTSYRFRLVAQHSGFFPISGGERHFLTFPSSRPRPGVRGRTRPGHIRHRPFVFTTSGRILRPASIPAPAACAGEVRVTFLLGRRVLATNLAGVAPNCTFSTATALGRVPRRRRHQARIKVLLHFTGNGYAAPANARPEFVRVG